LDEKRKGTKKETQGLGATGVIRQDEGLEKESPKKNAANFPEKEKPRTCCRKPEDKP